MNDKDNDGWCPIQLASFGGHAEAVALLLSSGADMHNGTNLGYTCFSLAKTDKVKFILRKWPTTMAILALKELGLYYFVETDSLIDLFHFLDN